MLGLAFLLAAGLPFSIDVFSSGENGYHTFRIPAIVATNKGTLLAFAEGRIEGRGDAGNIDLLLKRSPDKGRTWSPILTVADFGPDTAGNPAPVVDRRTGKIWLLFTSNLGTDKESAILKRTSAESRKVWVTHSTDDGITWAKPIEITSTVKKPNWTWYATGPGNGIQLKSGRLVVACDHNRFGEVRERYAHVIYSDDHGVTWKLGGSAGPDANESTVAELPNGSLMLNMRSYAGRNRRLVSKSTDGGLTWTDPVDDAALVEPVCEGSLLRTGKVILFSNPASNTRERLAIKVSRDGGKTWPVEKVIHQGPAAYSNLVELVDHSIGLLYENGAKSPYEKITFLSFGLNWLK